MDLGIPFKLLLALLLGGFLGLEREYHKEEIPHKKTALSSLGVRTFSLLTLLGALGGLMFTEYLFFSLILTSTVMLLILSNYVMSTLHTKDSGITTEIAGIFAYTAGFILMLTIFPLQLTVALTVIVTLILSRKEEIKNTIARFHKFETNAFITYAIIALVILPFLPDRAIVLSDISFLTSLLSAYAIRLGDLAVVEILNPYKLWFIVALITGIDTLGYFLNKYVGQKRGYILSAITGGFVSSTATTIALAQESKHSKRTNRLVGAAILSNTASFFQLVALLAPINGALLVKSTFLILSIIIAGSVSALFFLRQKNARGPMSLKKKTQTEVFSLPQALKFAGIYLLVRFGSGTALVLFGSGGLYVTSLLGALVGLDAVTINLADLTLRNEITVENGVVALLLANAANLIAKVMYSFFQGSRSFTVKFALSVCVIILSSIAGVIFTLLY